ncbi:MAG TPA: hypothetical protein VF317_00515, partial [Dermatophilaceae bacterium]
MKSVATAHVAVHNDVGLVPYVSEGPALLAGIADGPGLAAHRRRRGPSPTPSAEALVDMARAVDLRGRGGAGFPFAIKLAAAARRKAVVVVNASEGEPASHKDAALITCSPHLVLDGAAAVAHALGTREVHIALPSEFPAIRLLVEKALRER